MMDNKNIFSAGYQLLEEVPFSDIVLKHRDTIGEVYFSWPDTASGRGSVSNKNGLVDWEAQSVLEQELTVIKQAGISLNILWNGNCYGGMAISKSLENLVISTVSYLESKIGLDSTTTTSPFIASIIKKYFPHIHVKASVNMRLGTIEAMEYVSQYFDGFYLQREYNRDLATIKEIRNWCNENGKKLYMLANSGCLNFCSSQTFHDNLVAHEDEAAKTVNSWPGYRGACWDYYSGKDKSVFLSRSSWIRPEDIEFYREYFDGFKLATRVHSNPEKIIRAYAGKSFSGNILDLMEPSHSSLLHPEIINNTLFPEDWASKLSNMNKKQKEEFYKYISVNLVVTEKLRFMLETRK